MSFPFWLKVCAALLIGLLFGFLARVFQKRLPVSSNRRPVEEPLSRQVEIDGFRVHYQQLGLGPSLLLVHGIGSSIFCWRFLVRRLSKSFRVTVLDLPGFGASDKLPDADYGLDAQTERLAKFMETLSLGPSFVVGCSMGGAISLWLAKRYPDLVTRLAVIAPAAHRKVVFFDTRPLLGLVRTVGNVFVTPYLIEKIYRRVVSRQDLVTTTAIAEYYRPFSESKEAAICFWKANELLRDARMPEALATLTQDVLVLYGQRDKMVRSQYLNEIVQVLQTRIEGRAELALHPDGGHHLMEDEPDFVLGKLNVFFSADTESRSKS
jgi:pimeloyl-ACP methyl ester carboxylesterase